MIEFPPGLIEIQSRALAMFGRVGATRIYRVPALPGGVGVVGAAPPVTPPSIQWRRTGIALALYGCTDLATPLAAANMNLRVQMGPTEDLITTGQVGSDAPFAGLFGVTQNWFPLLRQIDPQQPWTFSYRNTAVLTAIPTVLIAVAEDPPGC